MNDHKRITDSFNKQGLMKTLGAEIILVEKGRVVIQCILNKGLTQQHGFFHAGVMTSIVDTACGYAGLSVMPDTADVLTVEFKINFLKPANTDKIIATGQVFQKGKTLVVCEGTVTDEKQETVFAKMMATMITLHK